jgi:hypothetical protein
MPYMCASIAKCMITSGKLGCMTHIINEEDGNVYLKILVGKYEGK